MKQKEYYNIGEAVKWIAFRGKECSLDELYKNKESINKAKDKLKFAATMKQISILGRWDDIPRAGQAFSFEEWDAISRNGYSRGLAPEKPITNIGENAAFHIPDNSIQQDHDVYREIKIPVNQLKQLFPPTPIETGEKQNDYITPYMEIMLETIREEGLSTENQSKKDILTDIIAKKMAARGLKESSNLAKAMATLIRMPESQNGRNRKG